MIVRACLASALVALFVPSIVNAADRPKLQGTYVREVGATSLQIDFKAPSVMEFTLKDGNGETLVITSEYTLARDNETLYGILIEKKGSSEGPEVGTPFSFKVNLKAKVLELSDLRAPESPDVRAIIEGDYQLTTP